MVQLLVLYGLANCLALALAAGLGYMGPLWFMVHFAAGFLGALSSIMWTGVAMFYLIYSGQAINRAVGAGLAAREDAEFARSAKMGLFPWYVTSIILLVMAPFFGATAQNQTGPAQAHHVAALASVGVFWYSVYRTRPVVQRTGALIAAILERIEVIKSRRLRNSGEEAGSGG